MPLAGAIPKTAAIAVADLLDTCAQIQPGQNVVIVAAVDGLHGGMNLVDEQTVADNPAVRSYTRLITPQEITESLVGFPGDPPPSPMTRVQVTLIAPDVRARIFADPVPAGGLN